MSIQSTLSSFLGSSTGYTSLEKDLEDQKSCFFTTVISRSSDRSLLKIRRLIDLSTLPTITKNNLALLNPHNKGCLYVRKLFLNLAHKVGRESASCKAPSALLCSSAVAKAITSSQIKASYPSYLAEFPPPLYEQGLFLRHLKGRLPLESTSGQLASVKKKDENCLVEDLDEIAIKLPQYNRETIQCLAGICRGSNEGCMKTLGLVEVVSSKQVFFIDGKSISSSRELSAIDLEELANNPVRVSIPSFVEFCADWEENVLASGEGNNILGDNVGLYFRGLYLQVPVVKAKAETLAYYGAVLIPVNTPIRFPSQEPYPIWKMHVGESYVRDYIMKEDGGKGLYLEFHHDQPHFHMIVNGGGYYLLAKQVDEGLFHLTAFELTNGQAVYTKKGALHCDATLKGDLVVGYTISEKCSTALFRTRETKEILKLDFVR